MRRYLFIILSISFLGLDGCISTPNDAAECYQVEKMRCEMRDRCYSNFDLDGCKYYYEEQCRARNIEPEYTEDEMSACLAQMATYGSNANECGELLKAEQAGVSELCEVDKLSECRPLACEAYYEDSESPDDTAITDTETSGGLNP